jgi:hypothetical protein
MARRLADLESLILATHARERSSVLPVSGGSAPTNVPMTTSDQKTSSSLSPFGGLPAQRTSNERVSNDDSTEDDAPSPPGADHILIDINNETHGVEYYGGSSSVAILDRLYKRARRQSSNRHQTSASHKPSVVNLLHNPEFHELSPTAVHNSPDGLPNPAEPISSRLIEGGFLTAFFDTLHFMHPVIDKNEFLEKCDKGAIDAENDFAALYYACLALAAITSPEKDPKLAGYPPIQWANLYVDRAKKCIPVTFQD